MITIEEGRRYLGVMPAVAEAAMGLKLVSFYPGNAGTSVPTHLASILLFRSDTGQPLAVMDGRLITEMRTAALRMGALGPPTHAARAKQDFCQVKLENSAVRGRVSRRIHILVTIGYNEDRSAVNSALGATW